MIKKLQRKFIFIVMGSLLLVIVVLIGAINLVNRHQINQKADALLQLLADNDGKFPEMEKDKPPKPNEHGFAMSEETKFETRYFLVRANTTGTVVQIDTSHIAAVSSSEAQQYAERILSSGNTTGYQGVYKYLMVQTQEGQLLVFLDCRTQLQTMHSFLLISCAIAFAAFLLVSLLVFIFSKRAIKPVIESTEKQKQFITDAGHEVKTPLAIISANTDVLELYGGDNEWIQSIRRQTTRLGALVNDLLLLARMDEQSTVHTCADFSLSDAVAETAEGFELLAAQKNKKLTLQIEPNLSLHGDENSIRKLVSILLDNAVKYAEENTAITLTLQSSGKGRILTVKNYCNNLPSGNLEKLFDRFYRVDQSRSRESGGYGIGLSIAKAIVVSHKGKITARREADNVLCISITL